MQTLKDKLIHFINLCQEKRERQAKSAASRRLLTNSMAFFNTHRTEHSGNRFMGRKKNEVTIDRTYKYISR